MFALKLRKNKDRKQPGGQKQRQKAARGSARPEPEMLPTQPKTDNETEEKVYEMKLI